MQREKRCLTCSHWEPDVNYGVTGSCLWRPDSSPRKVFYNRCGQHHDGPCDEELANRYNEVARCADSAEEDAGKESRVYPTELTPARCRVMASNIAGIPRAKANILDDERREDG